MLLRLVLALACSAVVLRYEQLKRRQDGAYRSEKPQSNEELGDGKEIYTYADAQATKEEEEEVKHVSTVSSITSSKSCQENDQLFLPELVDLFGGCIDVTTDSEKSADRVKFGEDGVRVKYESDESTESQKYESNSEDHEALEIFEALKTSAEADTQVSAGSPQLAELKALLASLQEKELKLEAELLEYYWLKEQEDNYLQLERQLWEKNKEIEKLNVKLTSLEEKARNLSKEVEGKDYLKEELEVSRAKVEDLQMMIQSDAGQTKAQLLMLKQQVSVLEEKEQEISKKDFHMERKLQALKELETEVLELRRTSKELQHQKRELTIELNAAEATIIELSCVTESDKVAQVQCQVSTLRLANEDLNKQVEGLQMNRFSEVEELVYLRWVNACLRYELRNSQAPPGKVTAVDLGKSLSPKSQEKAKQLMREYAGPDVIAAKPREEREQEYNSISSIPSTMTECEFDDSSIDDLSSKYSSGKKSRFIGKLKKWGRSNEAPELSLAASSIDSRKGRMQNLGHRRTKSTVTLESLFMRTSNDDLTTSGIDGFENDMHSSSNSIKSPGETASIETRSSVDANDLSTDVAASFEPMSKSVFSALEEKYPPFKDRHVLALDREKDIKERAEHPRAEKLVKMPESEAALQIEIRKDIPSEFDKASREIEKGLPIMHDKHASKKLNFDRFPQRVSDLVLATETNPVRLVVNKMKFSEVQKREPRVPKPAPKASVIGKSDDKIIAKPSEGRPPGPPQPPPPPPARNTGGPPPPPPPGSVKLQGPGSEKVQRAPEVVEFYQSLMRRDAKKDATMGASDANISDVRNNMIGEIENRSAFLLAVKADVETQGDFVQALAIEVRNAAYDDIEDVLGFVSWLDEELSYLVDERAVLKHFDWPESKADVFREAAFEYQDLKKLNSEISSFEDDPRVPCDSSLKQMLSLLEKVEQSVYAILRTRDMAIARYKEFNVPMQWMLDSGLVGKIKLATVQLARKYMERVALELDSSASTASIREPRREFLLLQGVRFAFRVHQFAGGFDAESMRTFEELRGCMHACSVDHSANETNETT